MPIYPEGWEFDPPIPEGAYQVEAPGEAYDCTPPYISQEDCIGDGYTEGCSSEQAQYWVSLNGTVNYDSFHEFTDYIYHWVIPGSFSCIPWPPGSDAIGKSCCSYYSEVWRVDDQPPEPSPCEQPTYEDYPATEAQRDKTIAGSGFKKNNPGCDCCKRVLIWDLGSTYTSSPAFGQPRARGYRFFDWSLVQRWFEEGLEEEVGSKSPKYPVDFVTGGATQDLGFYSDAGFDPYEYAVEEGFWTGDIQDYDLIIWPRPTDDTDLDGSSQPCPGPCIQPTEIWHETRANAPDHEHFGGLPDWWDEIERGDWNGRLMFITGANARAGELSFDFNPLGQIGYASNLFINTLVDTHGMIVDVDPMDTSGWFTDDTFEFMEVQEPRIADADLMEGVDYLWPMYYTSEVSGGETLLQSDDHGNQITTGPPWCRTDEDPGFTQDYDIMQRNRVEFEDGAIVDFVIAATPDIVPHTENAAPSVLRSFKQFYFNLMEVPLKEADQVVEG